MYEEWKAILSEINSELGKTNSDENFNPSNIVTRIKEFLKEKLQAQYQYIYIRWEEEKFNINYPFLLTKDNDLYGTYATLLHISADHGLEAIAKYLSQVQDININAQDTLEETPLHYAAKNGHVGVVMILLAADADVHTKDQHKATPLHQAARNGHVGVVEALVAADADVCAEDQHKATPLHLAAQSGHVGVVKVLVSSANFNAQNEHGNTPLHCAANEEVVKALIKAGADVNAKDKYGETPLHWAAKYANIDVAKALLAKGADIHAKNQDGNTPIDLAMEAKMKKCLETEKTIQFFKPIIIGISTCFVTAAFETGLAALLVAKGDLPIEPIPVILAVFAIAAITLTTSMLACQAFKPNKPSTKIDATQTLGNSNSTISSIHSVER